MIGVLNSILRFVWWLACGAAAVGLTLMVFLAMADQPDVDLNWLGGSVPTAVAENAGLQTELKLDAVTRIVVHEARLESSDPAVAWAGLLLVGMGVGLFLYGLSRLRRLVAAAAAGNPFVPESVTLIRQIGAAYLGYVLLRGVSQLVSLYLMGSALPGGKAWSSLTVSLDSSVLIALLLIFALAEVFAAGVQLREEADLTV